MLRFIAALACVLIAASAHAQPGPRGGRCCGGTSQSQTASPAPVSSNPVVEIAGVVGEVRIARGVGMPCIEVKHAGQTTVVYLGAMHYLIAQNFNPRTGEDVVVKGYKLADGIVSIQVTLPQENKSLKLRDDNGWPLWRGGRGRMMNSPVIPPK